uniref:AW19 n=1 Tax=Sorghum bicolor TaxID=4558 RepID=O49234_SORBI|nr:AW19 [Sorghum bicolor]
MVRTSVLAVGCCVCSCILVVRHMEQPESLAETRC